MCKNPMVLSDLDRSGVQKAAKEFVRMNILGTQLLDTAHTVGVLLTPILGEDVEEDRFERVHTLFWKLVEDYKSKLLKVVDLYY